MRKADRENLRMSHGLEALPALLASYENAKRCWSILDSDDNVIAMFGVGYIRNRMWTGLVWILASERIGKFLLPIARESRDWLAHIAEGQTELVNHVHVDNMKALRWLEWMGFERVRLVPSFGANGDDFWLVRYRPPGKTQAGRGG